MGNINDRKNQESAVRLAETMVHRGQPEMAQEPERQGV